MSDVLAAVLSMAGEFPGWQIGPLAGRPGMWEAYWRSPSGSARRTITAPSAGALVTLLRSAASRAGTAEHDGGDPGELLTPAEVAAVFGAGPGTAGQWARTGKLSSVRTPGGWRRCRAADVIWLRAPR